MGRNMKSGGGKGNSRRFREDKIRYYKPHSEGLLLNFLLEVMKDQSRTTIKSFLAHRQVAINGRAVTQFDTPVRPSDEVAINLDRAFNFFKHPMLRIVFEDTDLIVVDKAAGLLSTGTEREKAKTAFRILSDYIKRNDLRNRLYVVDRLDRESSGLMIFAKSPKAQTRLQSDSNLIIERKFIAIVEGAPEKEKGELRSYLAENRGLSVYSTSPEQGSLAITQYVATKRKGRYTQMDIFALTTVKNQIRVHLSEFGCPIAGDKKYGASTNPSKRLLLHSSKLSFIHPITKERLVLETSVPAKFKMVMEQ